MISFETWLIPFCYRFTVVTKTIVTLFLPWYKFVRITENNSKHHIEWHFIQVPIACYWFYQTLSIVKGFDIVHVWVQVLFICLQVWFIHSSVILFNEEKCAHLLSFIIQIWQLRFLIKQFSLTVLISTLVVMTKQLWHA